MAHNSGNEVRHQGWQNVMLGNNSKSTKHHAAGSLKYERYLLIYFIKTGTLLLHLTITIYSHHFYINVLQVF